MFGDGVGMFGDSLGVPGVVRGLPSGSLVKLLRDSFGSRDFGDGKLLQKPVGRMGSVWQNPTFFMLSIEIYRAFLKAVNSPIF